MLRHKTQGQKLKDELVALKRAEIVKRNAVKLLVRIVRYISNDAADSMQTRYAANCWIQDHRLICTDGHVAANIGVDKSLPNGKVDILKLRHALKGGFVLGDDGRITAASFEVEAFEPGVSENATLNKNELPKVSRVFETADANAKTDRAVTLWLQPDQLKWLAELAVASKWPFVRMTITAPKEGDEFFAERYSLNVVLFESAGSGITKTPSQDWHTLPDRVVMMPIRPQ